MIWTPDSIIHDRYQLLHLKRDRPGHQVWLALDQASNQRVIIKTLSFTGQIHWDEVKLFEREISVLQRLDHPRIPTYVDDFTLEHPHYQKCLVESYLHAPSLQAFLDRQQDIPLNQIWAIASQVLDILNDLHRQDPPILHRDIKPSNILIDRDKQVYLIDLGSIGVDRENLNNLDVPTTVGSYGYTPMEQFMGQAQQASDLYALGATLMQLISQTAPTELLSSKLRLLLPTDCQVVAPYREWLYRLTAPQAIDRFQTAQDAQDALKAIQSRSPALTETVSKTYLNIDQSELEWRLTLVPVWNTQTISSRDLGLLLGLMAVPLVFGVIEAQRFLSLFQGFGLWGTEILTLGLCVTPALLFAPRLFRQLLQQELVLRPGQWIVVKRLLAQVQISSQKYDWCDLSSIHLAKNAKQRWQIKIQDQTSLDQSLVQYLTSQDVIQIYRTLEDANRYE